MERRTFLKSAPPQESQLRLPTLRKPQPPWPPGQIYRTQPAASEGKFKLFKQPTTTTALPKIPKWHQR